MKRSEIKMMRNRVAMEKVRADLSHLISRHSLTKTETALEDGLDPTAEEIGMVPRRYHEPPGDVYALDFALDAGIPDPP